MNREIFTQKRIVLIGITILSIIFTFLTLLFKIYDYNVNILYELSSSGNGFDVISSYPNALKGCGKWLGIFSIILLVSVSIELLVYVISVIKTNRETKYVDYYASKLGKKEIIILILNIVLTLIYLINCVVAKREFMEAMEHSGVFKTFGYIPFIINLIFLLGYIAVLYLLQSSSVKTNSNVVNSSVGAADEILKYKELLDKGIITQEEFDAKRKQLLKL